MTKTISIHEGITYEYLIHGLFVFLVGGFFCFAIPVLGIVILFVGFLLMVMSTGLEVDIPGERIRKYKSVLFLKFGSWESLKR